MKKVRFLLMFIAAIMVAQISNAQIIKVDPILWDDFELAPSDWGGWLPETMVSGQIWYYIQGRYDKFGIPVIHVQSKATPLIGESGTVYKYHDVIAQGDDLMQPTYEQAEGYTYAMKFIGQFKIHALGGGIVASGRTQIHIVLDEEGHAVINKYVNYFW